jgi:hypothetical protein
LGSEIVQSAWYEILTLYGLQHLRLADKALDSPTSRVCTLGETNTFTKVVALSMQMLDRKLSEEPVLMVEEQPIEYEA